MNSRDETRKFLIVERKKGRRKSESDLTQKPVKVHSGKKRKECDAMTHLNASRAK